ncbi:MAG: hypothetical protein PQJ60_11295 [Spirochaetales bacterium]|nr:hypothetical protein [Spirochaetales bacterium]
MRKFLIPVYLLIGLITLGAYTPPKKLNGPVLSVRTYKILLREIPAGGEEEPWLPNIDYDENLRPLVQYYFDRGQEYRRHEFRYETDGEGRERTLWTTYFITPDGKPPLRRLAGYEHWYTLYDGDDPARRETRFETVQGHPVKSVYRYYDEENRLVRETDTRADLDVEIRYDREGRPEAKRGYRGESTFWEERYFYDETGRLKSFNQTDLNRQLYERGEYSYEENRIVFSRYVLDHPATEELESTEPLGTPVFQSLKDYDDRGNLLRLRNYNWNGPMGLLLTEEYLYEYDELNRPVVVREPHSRETWTLTYDGRDNWIGLTYRDELNHPGEEPLAWKRVIRYAD